MLDSSFFPLGIRTCRILLFSFCVPVENEAVQNRTHTHTHTQVPIHKKNTQQVNVSSPAVHLVKPRQALESTEEWTLRNFKVQFMRVSTPLPTLAIAAVLLHSATERAAQKRKRESALRPDENQGKTAETSECYRNVLVVTLRPESQAIPASTQHSGDTAFAQLPAHASPRAGLSFSAFVSFSESARSFVLSSSTARPNLFSSLCLLPSSYRTLDAARLDQGIQSSQICVAPIVQHKCEEAPKQDMQRPLSAWARFDGR